MIFPPRITTSVFLLPEYEGDERDGDDEQIEEVESGPAERSRMEDEPVGDDLEAHLDGEDGREEVVEVVQNLEGKKA